MASFGMRSSCKAMKPVKGHTALQGREALFRGVYGFNLGSTRPQSTVSTGVSLSKARMVSTPARSASLRRKGCSRGALGLGAAISRRRRNCWSERVEERHGRSE